MIRPAIDARLAERVREIASLERDSVITDDGRGGMSGEEKSRVLNIAADLLEEYIMLQGPPVAK